ncbi:MAG: hypothetical protein WC091_04585 [Sulfuricellaceae bacterium]
MTILESDIKLIQSERLTEYDDGGGRMSGVEVTDGAVNNLFPDISRLDRVYGRVSLRKAFASVTTANTDTYYGAHVIITNPPADPHVNVTLFTTKSWTDERAAARDRVESYLAISGVSRLVLYGDHLTGQRTVMVYCRTDTVSPEVGEVYCLSQEKIGYDTVAQYVRITKVVSRVSTVFQVSGECGTFSRDVITFEISNPLRYKFSSAEVTCLTQNASPTVIRFTVVADAAQYCGVKKLSQDAALGALSVKVPGIFGQIVPSTQIESPVLDTLAGMGKTALIPSGDEGSLSVSQPFNQAANSAATLYFGSPFCRGSLVISSPAALKDDGSGNIVAASGGANGYSGTANYETGAISLSRTSAWSGNFTASATPAGVAVDSAHTDSVAITAGNRQYNYIANLQPTPAPRTLSIDYRAQGKWVRLYDDGLGKLAGREGEGSGTVNYATGSVLLTVGALPDVGSSIIYSWGTGVHYERRGINAGVSPVIIPILCDAGLQPGTISITYLNGGKVKTVTDDGHNKLTGDGAGTVGYAFGDIFLIPAWIPDVGSTITVTYEHKEAVNNGQGEVFQCVNLSGVPSRVTFTDYVNGIPGRWHSDGGITLGAIVPGSLYFLMPGGDAWVYDKGDGTLSLRSLRGFDAPVIDPNYGTINYTTGVVAFSAIYQKIHNYWDAAAKRWVSVPKDAGLPDCFGNTVSELWAKYSTIRCYYVPAGAAVVSGSTITPMPSALVVDLTPTTTEQVVPGSVRIACGNATVIDRNGTLLKDINKLNNAGTPIGSIDYVSGEMRFTEWGGTLNTIAVQSLLTRKGQWNVNAATFRTPGNPIRPGSFYVRARAAADNTLITGTADMNGAIAGTGLLGHVEAETGVVDVGFGSWQQDAELTTAQKAASWYVAPIAPATLVWVPTPVLPDSIFFNCIVYSNMPLDADLLGLDPVRLPMDGRVPVFKQGNVAVIHDTVTTPLPDALLAGQVLTLPRANLAYAVLRDANGVKIPTSFYTPDLAAGTLVMRTPLDLTAYAQPLECEHRIEDMALVSDVQITGDITFVAPLAHSYSAANSYISSALIIGDMQARVSKFFSQYTWTGVWSDSLIGSSTTAQYNDTVYPVAVHNLGAIEERWAILFTSAGTFNIVGETVGVIASGSTSASIAPLNPATQTPYFTLQAAGWGSGWAANNVVRFTTHAANYPLWIARTTTMGDVVAPDDDFKLQIRGDAD